ncbi:MAG: bifunctional sterol desaturase/short chain dehydrogenase [Cyanophyceae cyanobacterium]
MVATVWIALALESVLLEEVIRDFYHVAGHTWEPIKQWHNTHHKAFRKDLTMVSFEAFSKAQWCNDVPASPVIGAIVAIAATGAGMAFGWVSTWTLWLGVIYSLGFGVAAIARSQNRMMWTDLTHEPGPLTDNPARWFVNRTYHWRHHFDSGNAYYCGTLTAVDKILGTALSLQGKTVAVTGASGTLGRALLKALKVAGARPIALTTSANVDFGPRIPVHQWQPGQEHELQSKLANVDILIINHGINEAGERSPEAIAKAYEVNTMSAWRLMETFLDTVTLSKHRALKEVWVNTSEAEVQPAFSPLYEMSKRAIGDIITLRRLDAPCVIRKLVLGPFKSNLNPVGVMDANFVARGIVELAKRDFRDIIVTINPLTYVTFPLKEVSKSLYFRMFSKGKRSPHGSKASNPIGLK